MSRANRLIGKKADGTPLQLVKVTGFTDSEERAVGLTDKVPALIEVSFANLVPTFKQVLIGENVVARETHYRPKSCFVYKCAEAFVAAL